MMRPCLLLAFHLFSVGVNSFSFAPPLPRRRGQHLPSAVPVYKGPVGDPLDMVWERDFDFLVDAHGLDTREIG